MALGQPAYGRSKKGGEWKLERDLAELLALSGRLLRRGDSVLCLTCHREGWTPGDAARAIRDAIPGAPPPETVTLSLTPADGGNALPAGFMVVVAGRQP